MMAAVDPGRMPRSTPAGTTMERHLTVSEMLASRWASARARRAPRMFLLRTFREWVRAHKETGLHATAILQVAEAEAEFDDKVLALQNAIGAEHRMLRTENEAARRFVKEAEGRVRDATEQAA